MLIRGPVVVLNIILLKLVPINPLFAYLTIFTQGMSLYYWIPLHYLFSRSTSRKNLGGGYAFFTSSARVASFMSPIIGALIITLSSYQTLFNVTAVILLFSSVPLLFSKDVKIKFHLFDKKSFRNNICFLTKTGAEGIINWVKHFFWPITIFLMFGETMSVGYASSLIVLTSVILTYIISFAKNRKSFLVLSGAMGLLLFSTVNYVQNVPSIVLFSVLFGVQGVLLSTPVTLMFYASERKYKDIVLWREVFLHAPIGLFAVFCSFLPSNIIIQGMFLLTALINLFLLK
jgi:hypothetical protein